MPNRALPAYQNPSNPWLLRSIRSAHVAVLLQACMPRLATQDTISLSTLSKCAGAQANSAAMPRPADTAAESTEDLHAAVAVTCEAVELMLTLLESHPLSQQSPPEVSTAQPAQHQALPMNSAASSTAAGVPPQAQAASPLSEKWPTPKPTQWQDIELVAMRACTTLGWALSPAAVRQVPAEALHDLAARLYLLIEGLVIGHLPDLHVSVYKLFTLGLQPILSFHVQGEAEDTSLAVAMLSRLANDSSVIPVGCTYAAEICNVFCKSDSSMTLVCRCFLAVCCIQANHVTHVPGRLFPDTAAHVEHRKQGLCADPNCCLCACDCCLSKTCRLLE